jgi:hypothetical protein
MKLGLSIKIKITIVVSIVVSVALGARAVHHLLQRQRAPSFYAVVGSHTEAVDPRDFAVLRGSIDLQLHNATIPEALTAIEHRTSLRFDYQSAMFPPDARVSLDARDISVAAALTQILLDCDVDVEIAPYGRAQLVPRIESSHGSHWPIGSVLGRVQDSNMEPRILRAIMSLHATPGTSKRISNTVLVSGARAQYLTVRRKSIAL